MKYSGIKKTLVAVLMAVVSLQGGVWGQNYQVSGTVSDAENSPEKPTWILPDISFITRQLS